MTDLTANGAEMREGLRVFTSNCRWATVKDVSFTSELEGTWWNVVEDGRNTPTLLNGERCSTVNYITSERDPHPEEIKVRPIRISQDVRDRVTERYTHP